MSASGGEEGGSPKADIVREVAWIYSYRSDQNADKGGEGVKNPENFAYVLNGWPQRGVKKVRWRGWESNFFTPRHACSLRGRGKK